MSQIAAYTDTDWEAAGTIGAYLIKIGDWGG